ncbi:MAG: hypothetical protein ISS61_04580 [Desulfobacteraceae bacterium]|nr:hypothetical protein [Desulfobacteraceae bacterium]
MRYKYLGSWNRETFIQDLINTWFPKHDNGQAKKLWPKKDPDEGYKSWEKRAGRVGRKSLPRIAGRSEKKLLTTHPSVELRVV